MWECEWVERGWDIKKEDDLDQGSAMGVPFKDF